MRWLKWVYKFVVVNAIAYGGMYLGAPPWVAYFFIVIFWMIEYSQVTFTVEHRE